MRACGWRRGRSYPHEHLRAVHRMPGDGRDVLLGCLPLAVGVSLGLDRLSAFFLLIIAVGTLPPTLYAMAYARHYGEKQASLGFMLNVFIPSMMLVVLARNVLTFLVFWEAMSLASYFLVMTESEPRTDQAIPMPARRRQRRNRTDFANYALRE